MQDYKILDVKKGTEWSNSYGTFQGYTLALEGHGEPVMVNKKVPVSQEPQVGDALFGSIEVRHNKAGNEYSVFKAEKRPEGQPSSQASGWSENPDRQDSIQRSVALQQAVLWHGSQPKLLIAELLSTADEFYSWLKNQPLEGKELVDKIFPKNEEDHNDESI